MDVALDVPFVQVDEKSSNIFAFCNAFHEIQQTLLLLLMVDGDDNGRTSFEIYMVLCLHIIMGQYTSYDAADLNAGVILVVTV